MSVLLRILLIAGAIIMMAFMLKRIRYAKLKIEYSIFWMGFSSILVLMGIFPELLYVISGKIGFQSPISMVYLIIIFVLIIKLFFTTIQISQLENKIDCLTQQIAKKKKKNEEDN